MITIKKTQGVQTSNHMTCIWIQEGILDFKKQCPTSKVVIDAEKINFYKFGLPMGLARHSTSGLIYNNGHLHYAGFQTPIIRDRDMCVSLFKLFNLNNPL